MNEERFARQPVRDFVDSASGIVPMSVGALEESESVAHLMVEGIMDALEGGASNEPAMRTRR